MDFKTRRGGLATGDSIKRRLNELVEEGKISVSANERNEAMFSIKSEYQKRTHTFIPIIWPDGRRAMREVVS